MSPSFLSRSSIYSYCSRLDSASLAFQLFRYTYLKLTPKGDTPHPVRGLAPPAPPTLARKTWGHPTPRQAASAPAPPALSRKTWGHSTPHQGASAPCTPDI